MSAQVKTLNGVALVTGAGSGIGRELCLAYAQAGCRAIALADIKIEGIDETISLIKARGYTVQTLALERNVTDVVSVKRMVSDTVSTFGSLDYAANVAGITTTARVPTAQYPHEEYDKILEINTKGILICMQEQIQVMQKQNPTCTPGIDNPLRAQRGSIVNIASITGFAALQNMMPYNVSKHAVIGLTKSAAIDHAPQEIRINAVCPGMTETPMVAARKTSTVPGKSRGWAVEGNGRQRLAIPEEIADVFDAGHLAALRYDRSSC
ncbi:uncharacterized protein N7458_012656 [Penicillium daleae]|uniref:Uncharacterized protein n=1 Tax=Penicillium daleae TaxID=63821 RepID=A0AAD6FYJ5_9EURO|nr:uncharacterized protein N7458_012656 [Penicillium daleae]KAJ5433500.1 hypothetical protein N7458_012656 [Penicillium daleae]